MAGDEATGPDHREAGEPADAAGAAEGVEGADGEGETDPDEEWEEYFDDIDPGAGCTEIWEHISARREDG